MKIIIGLGNPGDEYKNTKHNVGFLAIEYLLNKHNIQMQHNKFNGLFTKVKINNKDVIFAKPQTYMNLSGDFVQKIVSYFNISNENILVIYDDISINLGRIKITKKGSSGGHNGIKDIINKLSTEEFKRVKIGIKNDKINKKELKEIVLSRFNKEETDIIQNQFQKLEEIILHFLNDEIEKAMNKIN